MTNRRQFEKGDRDWILELCYHKPRNTWDHHKLGEAKILP